ncbi:MAG: VWA domain-containing protein, partial [Planctomycetota bacterium]
LLRTLIITALVFTLARPLVPGAWTFGAEERQRSVSVLVIDDSCSMAASLGTETAFQRACARARQILGELGEDSMVALVLAAHPPRALIPQPTRDMIFVEQELARLEARDSALDLPAALQEARAILAVQEDPNHEVLIFSDAQRNGWADHEEDIARELRALADANCSLFAFLTPPPAGDNIAVIALSPEEEIITAAAPTTFRVRLKNYASEDSVEVPVELLVDGEKVARRMATLPPDQEAVVPLRYRVPFPGRHAFEARCGVDVLNRDNHRFSVRTVYEQIPLLLVDGDPQPEVFRSAGGYLQAALAPIDPDDPMHQALLDVRRRPYDRLESISKPRVIVLAEVDTLSPQRLVEIQSAVREGVGLLVIASSAVTPDNFENLATSGDNALLQLEVAGIAKFDEDEEPVRIQLETPLHPALQIFEDAALRDILLRVPFPTHLEVTNLGGTARVLARFTDGSPALIESDYGEGRILLFTGSADRERGNFPLSPAFVPFFREMILYLAKSGEEEAEQLAGEPLTWRDPGDVAGTSIIRPDGTSESAARFFQEDPAAGQRMVYPDADVAGIYTLRATTAAGQSREDPAAANVPETESTLDMLSPSDLRAAFPKLTWIVVEPEGSVGEALRRGRFGTELWPWALLILVALIILEAVLARAFSPKPVDTELLAGTV